MANAERFSEQTVMITGAIGGLGAAMARAFGGYGERVTKADDIVAAIKRGIEATQKGQPALLEFITEQETEVSRPWIPGGKWENPAA